LFYEQKAAGFQPRSSVRSKPGKFKKIRKLRISFKDFREREAGEKFIGLQRMDSVPKTPCASVGAASEALMTFLARVWHWVVASAICYFAVRLQQVIKHRLT
jgi:hypothetical protein